MTPSTCNFGPKALACALFISLGLVPAVQAQTPAPASQTAKPSDPTKTDKDTIELDPFQVVASKEGSYTTTTSNSITRFNADLQQIPVSTDIFTRDFMLDTASTVLEDMIAQYGASAGLTINQNLDQSTSNQAGQRTAFALSSRGLSSGDPRRDGLPIGNAYFFNSDLWDIERVEVARGPAAGTLYGASGPGGSINQISKQARFNNQSYMAMYRADGYGTGATTLEANVGGDKVAGKFVLYNNMQRYRMDMLSNDYRGAYGQLAFRLPFNSTLRLLSRWTDTKRVANAQTNNILLNGTGITDPRHNDSLAYLLAAGKTGPINPDTGLAYPTGVAGGPAIRSGEILNGLLTWNNVDSWGGDSFGDRLKTKQHTASLDSTWNPWLATSAAWTYLRFDHHFYPVQPTVLAPNSWGVAGSGVNVNPFNEWAVGSLFRSQFADFRIRSLRASALLTNDFFGKRIHSQTSIGWDRTDTVGGLVNIQYYKSDAEGNIIYGTPGGANDGLGRTTLPTLYWSVNNGPVKNPYLKLGAKTFNYQGEYYTYDFVNPRNPSYVGPGNPLGLSSIAKNLTTAQLNGINTYPYGNLGKNDGVYFSNFSSWFGDRFTTLVNYRRSSVSTVRPNSLYTDYVYRTDHYESYSGGLSYALTKTLNIYYNYGHNFFPNFSPTSTSGSPADPFGRLPPVAYFSNGQEIGLKWRTKDNKYSAQLNYSTTTSEGDSVTIPGSPQNVVNNNVGLNGRYMVDGATPGPAVPTDTQSDSLELILTAQPTANWRFRLTASIVQGKFDKDISYPILWNDEFYYDKATGGVRYSNGLPFLVPTAANTAGISRVRGLNASTDPATITGPTQQLTVAMMSDPSSPYYAYATTAGVAGPLTVAGNIVSNNPVYRALKWFSLPGSAASALTGRTGLPVSDIPYAYSDPSHFNGVYRLVNAGDIIAGTPKYMMSFTTNYNFTRSSLKGFGIGGSVNLAFDRTTFYYYETDSTGGLTRNKFSAPLVTPLFSLSASYQRKFKKVTWRSQFNINNALNRNTTVIYPNAATGYASEADLNGGLATRPREIIWTNTFSF